MMRILLVCCLLIIAVPAWCAETATPATTAAEYPAQPPAPGTADPATAKALKAMSDQLAAASKPWYSDLGSGAMVAGVAALAVVEKFAPAIITRVLPAAGPYGGLISLILSGILSLVRPKAAKEQERLATDHADAFRFVSTVIQATSNNATVAQLKANLSARMPDELRSVIDAYVQELEASGVDHPPAPTAAPAQQLGSGLVQSIKPS